MENSQWWETEFALFLHLSPTILVGLWARPHSLVWLGLLYVYIFQKFVFYGNDFNQRPDFRRFYQVVASPAYRAVVITVMMSFILDEVKESSELNHKTL